GQSSGIERYFIDHPDPRKRVGDVRKEIAALESKNPSIGTTRIDRSPFVRQLDGVITAASTMQTTIRNNTVFNRRYGIIITAPSGWQATSEPGALFVLAPQTTTGARRRTAADSRRYLACRRDLGRARAARHRPPRRRIGHRQAERLRLPEQRATWRRDQAAAGCCAGRPVTALQRKWAPPRG